MKCRYLLATGCLVVSTVVGCQAPRNYYLETAYMMRLGEETRAESGRKPGEPLVPTDANRSVVVPIDLKGMTDSRLERLPDGAALADPTTEVTRIEATSESSLPMMSVDFDRAKFVTFLRSRYEIAVIEAKAINGRLAKGENILRVEFIPRARTDDSTLKEFLLICAATVGMDAKQSVDTVIGMGVNAQLLPTMSLRLSLSAFREYQDGRLSLTDLRKQLEWVKY